MPMFLVSYILYGIAAGGEVYVILSSQCMITVPFFFLF
jgi:hypothetical protein